MQKKDVYAVVRNLLSAGVSEWEAALVLEKARELSDEEIIKILETINPEAAVRYRKFTAIRVLRSDNSLEPFRKERITDSLIRETGIPRGIAEKIAAEIEENLKYVNIKILPSSLIRELVAAKLFEYGLEEARKKYTRLGIPVYDLSILLQGEECSKIEEAVLESVFKAFFILNYLPEDLLHFLSSGALQIPDMGKFYRPYYSIVVELTPRAPLDALWEAFKSCGGKPTILLSRAEKKDADAFWALVKKEGGLLGLRGYRGEVNIEWALEGEKRTRFYFKRGFNIFHFGGFARKRRVRNLFVVDLLKLLRETGSVREGLNALSKICEWLEDIEIIRRKGDVSFLFLKNFLRAAEAADVAWKELLPESEFLLCFSRRDRELLAEDIVDMEIPCLPVLSPEKAKETDYPALEIKFSLGTP